MTGLPKIPKFSIEEYLAFEENAEYKHEFVNGSIFAMTGASRKHIIICGNIFVALRNTLKGSRCNVFASDLKVFAQAANSIYYPDVVVECISSEKHEDYSDSPSIIFEVLSKSTATTDRREKLAAYRMLDSLQSYVIVYQSRKHVVHYQRVGEEWLMQEFNGYGELVLRCSNEGTPTARLTLDEIYENVRVEDGPDLQVREEGEALVW